MGFGEFAEEEYGAAVGLEFAGVGAGETETNRVRTRIFRLWVHVYKHSQRGPADESLRNLVDVVLGFRLFFVAPRFQTKNHKQSAHENEHQYRPGSDHTKAWIVSVDPPKAVGDGCESNEYRRKA